jgi:hypothetical protein
MKNAVFWDVAPCRSCVNRRFGGTYRLHVVIIIIIIENTIIISIIIENKTRNKTQQEGIHTYALGEPYINN